MNINNVTVGKKVKSICEFAGVPAGTEGVIIEDYGPGFMVAWDLPGRPALPFDMGPLEVAKMYGINPDCPLRDGFDKATELQYLEAV